MDVRPRHGWLSHRRARVALARAVTGLVRNDIESDGTHPRDVRARLRQRTMSVDERHAFLAAPAR